MDYLLGDKKDLSDLECGYKKITTEEKRRLIVTAKVLNKLKTTFISNDFESEGFDQVYSRIKPKPYTQKGILRYLNYAALILVFFVSSIYVYNLGEKHENNIEYFDYYTSSFQNSKLKLPDGSFVYLKENSHIRIPTNFSEHNRKVELVGMAYFEVFHNPDEIFELKSGEYKIRVLGTKFNVRNYIDEDIITTSLDEGKVAIDLSNLTQKNNDEIILKKYQKFTFNKKSSQYVLNQFDKSFKISWKNNSFSFKEKRFGEIIKCLSLYFNTELIVEDSTSLDEKVTAKFNNRDLTEILKSLKLLYKFDIEKKNKTIHIKNNKQKSEKI